MNEINISGSAIEDIKSEGKEYFRIERAAALLKCESDDILHFGVLGKVQIIGPVICAGNYEWPLGDEMILIPELDRPFTRPFDPADRVILPKTSLAHIEAIGWVKPTSFSTPHAVREAIETIKEFIDDRSKSLCTESTSNIEIDYKNVVFVLDSFLAHNLHSPWRLIDQAEDNEEKITINHLSISKEELTRLASGNPQDSKSINQIELINKPSEKKVHGNTINNERKRAKIYEAALYCSIHFPESCNIGNFRLWAETIDQKGHIFWPDSGVAPFKPDHIERILSQATKK